MDDDQRRQIKDVFEYLDVAKDGCILPKLAVRLCRSLGFEVSIEEMDPSEGLTLEDVTEIVEEAYMRSKREPMQRLLQIHALVAGSSNFITVPHVQTLIEGAQNSALDASGGPVTEGEIQALIDEMVFNPRPEVRHATKREFEEFLTVGCPRTLRTNEPFDSRPHESYADFAARAAIEKPSSQLLIAGLVAPSPAHRLRSVRSQSTGESQ